MSFGLPEQTKKSFWERREGTTGMVTLGAAVVGLWFIKDVLLGFITTAISIVGQTIVLGALGVILFGLANIVANKRVRTLISFIFKSAMRKLTSVWAEIDPIGIMRSYVETLIEKREVVSESRDKLKGQIRILERQIAENNSKYDNAMSIAAQANKQGNENLLRVQTSQAGRMEKLNKTSFLPLLTQLQIHLRALDKCYEVTGTIIADLQNEVDAREIERKMILTSHSAMKAAKQILSGGTAASELFDQAMEFVVEDFGMKLGEIDSFLENSKSFIDGLDMQNGAYEAEALKKLQAWEQKADNILSLGAPSAAQPVELVRQSNYEALIRK